MADHHEVTDYMIIRNRIIRNPTVNIEEKIKTIETFFQNPINPIELEKARKILTETHHLDECLGEKELGNLTRKYIQALRFDGLIELYRELVKENPKNENTKRIAKTAYESLSQKGLKPSSQYNPFGNWSQSINYRGIIRDIILTTKDLDLIKETLLV